MGGKSFGLMAMVGVTAGLVLTSCGGNTSGLVDEGVLGSEDPVGDPYKGPLYVEAEAGHPHNLTARTGAAGLVVDCESPVRGGFQPGPYKEGATADNVAEAFDVATSERIYDGVFRDYRIERDEGDRLLFTFAVDGVVKQALIMHDGLATEGAGGPGWYVESWARCDLSEFPDWVAEDNWGAQIWADDEGNRMVTTTIVSYPGPEHCGWQASTFLYMNEASNSYVRKPPKDLMADYFDEPFRPDVVLPVDAVNTGYERRGQRLWLSPDRARAYVGTPESVELWPRTLQRLGCE